MRESFEKSALIERERNDLLLREKVLQIKLGEAEEKLLQAQKKIKFFSGRDT